MSDLLFAYGFLQRSHRSRFPELQSVKLEYLCKAQARGTLYYLGEYPGAKFMNSSPYWIHGEVFRIKDSASIEVLDAFEGIDDPYPEYRRIIIDVRANKRIPACWAYDYIGPTDRSVIQSGMF